MTRTRFFVRLMVGLLALMLCACVDVHEEYWVHGNGGGRGEIHYQIPAAAVRLYGGESKVEKQIAAYFAETPALKHPDYHVFSTDNVTHVDVKFAFDSVLQLKDLAGKQSASRLPPAARHLVGIIHCKMDGRALDFQREIDIAQALPQALFLSASRQQQHRLTYIFHLPVTVTSSNATQVLDDGHTLVWDVSLAQALKGPFTTRVTMKIPLPWLLLAGTAVPLSFGCGWLVVRQWRRRRTTPELARVDLA